MIIFHHKLGLQLKQEQHVTGTWRGSIGELLVTADWQVRVLSSYGIIYIPSDRMYAHAITMSGFMERHSNYILFYSQA